ncbi:MAG: acetylglutamate kinase [Myxococcota bacterium]|nr:acetylglutamate kinase [Myxococcota bacterium]
MLKALQDKATVLVEALPYIQRFSGEILVVKYGGHAMTNADAAASFAQDVVLLNSIGIKVVVVHGGGPQIQAALDALGIESTFRHGYRVTNADTMRVVRQVLVGQVNQDIVARINLEGGRAIGLSGADAGLLTGRKVTVDGEEVGRVGIIERVDTRVLHGLLDHDLIPVIAPVAVDTDGEALNVNADLAAGVVASQLMARKLLLMTDVAGVLDAQGAVMSQLARDAIPGLLEHGTLTGGMIPKMKCASDALSGGVRKVHIVDGRLRHAMLLELFTDRGVGTEVI